jgi:hypothetical protein
VEPVGRRWPELVAFGIDLVKKLRGRDDLWAAGVMLGPMETTNERLARLSLHYVITLSNLGDPASWIAIAVNLEGWNPQHGKTSELVLNRYVKPEQFGAELQALAADVLRKDAAMRSADPPF